MKATAAVPAVCTAQVQRNVQRTLAVELQRLSVAFRRQQKAYLERLRAKDGGGASGSGALSASTAALLDAGGRGGDIEAYDPGFTDLQVSARICVWVRARRVCVCARVVHARRMPRAATRSPA